MTIRFYLMPAVTELIGERTTRHPKYDALYAGSASQAMDYGREGIFLVAADVNTGTHNAIAANADVATFPANLDSQIGASLATVTTQAESRNIPMAGITATSTYRQLLRRVVLCCHLGQRLEGRYAQFREKAAPLFGNGITLDSAFSDLDAKTRAALLRVFESFQLDRSTLTGASTLRQIFIAFRDQWLGGAVDLLGVQI